MHIQCYKLAQSLSPHNLSAQKVMQLAQFARPLISPTCLPVHREQTNPPPVPLSSHIKLRYDTDVGRLIAEMERRLPLELQQMVFSHIPLISQSLTRCFETVNSYFPASRRRPPRNMEQLTYRPLQNCLEIKQLGVNIVNILGEPCISEIGSDSQGWHCEIQVSDVPVDGIQVALGSYGLIALRVLYADASKSPWLGGQSSRRWYQTFRGSLQDLKVMFDVRFDIPNLHHRPL